nr:MAG TPA: hypothetical protein [Caudoviricetes sp.]
MEIRQIKCGYTITTVKRLRKAKPENEQASMTH